MTEPNETTKAEVNDLDATADEELFLPEEDEEASGGAEPMDGLAERLQELERERDEMKDRYLRKAADFENARRRHQKEKDDLHKYAAEKVLREMVSVLDDLERASAAAKGSKESADATGLSEGVDMVIRKFRSTLERFGVQGFASQGEVFDPNLHEALQRVEDASVPHNTIVQEFQRGYRLAERLLRPAMVIVAQGGPPVALESDAAIGDDEAGE